MIIKTLIIIAILILILICIVEFGPEEVALLIVDIVESVVESIDEHKDN